ncbi:MAG: response regulator transcription factor [Syntrophaceticus sp.]
MVSVIVVDDYGELRSLVVTFLNAYSSFQVVGEAQNGCEAVEMVEQLKPQIVLMDIIMPVMDGLTATRMIKKRFPDVFVILYSGDEDEENLKQVKEAGADLHLTKPLDLEELIIQMSELLSLS